MLSALTLLKADQGTTLAKLDAILAKIGNDPDKAREAAEWQAIRKVVSADMMAK